MEQKNILQALEEADMVLVGLGEEFGGEKALQENTAYVSGKQLLQETGYHWLLPAWIDYCLARMENDTIKNALEKLEQLLRHKNYFIVSVSTNRVIEQIAWKEERLVMPCGGSGKKQCARGCLGETVEVTAADNEGLREIFEWLYEGQLSADGLSVDGLSVDGLSVDGLSVDGLSVDGLSADGLLADRFPADRIPTLGRCSQCGGEMILNNIYAEHYDESGYLESWKRYTKWLQGTLNRKLLIMELGVSLRFPSVIRWPFEKVAFFNHKAQFYRVNEKLYQMTEELSSKGVGISQNAIDWIKHL